MNKRIRIYYPNFFFLQYAFIFFCLLFLHTFALIFVCYTSDANLVMHNKSQYSAVRSHLRIPYFLTELGLSSHPPMTDSTVIKS